MSAEPTQRTLPLISHNDCEFAFAETVADVAGDANKAFGAFATHGSHKCHATLVIHMNEFFNPLGRQRKAQLKGALMTD